MSIISYRVNFMKQLTILGSTGSIGLNVLSIVQKNPKLFSIIALVAKSNVKLMIKQCQLFKPKYAVMFNKNSAKKLEIRLKKNKLFHTEVLSGEYNICKVAELKEVNVVVSAIVGSAGLMPTMSAIKTGKIILLANKESLVISGSLFMRKAKKNKAKILPIDSEHSAIFQSLPISIQRNLITSNLKKYGVKNIILTGSGGPLKNIKISNLKNVTPQQACYHPNWSMGKKISVDSATMMNKGLEYIEANWLFNAKSTEIEIIVHPQSIIHSMVRYIDGNIIAQLGVPNMKIPIAYAMSWPNRIKSDIVPLDFTNLDKLSFYKPDFKRYPCLKLAIEAYKSGQSYTIALNAANEITVDAFLNKKIFFTDIANINTLVLENSNYKEPKNIEEIIIINKEVRYSTKKLIKKYLI